jgi:hypothetical protein
MNFKTALDRLYLLSHRRKGVFGATYLIVLMVGVVFLVASPIAGT